jgi:NAD-dependent deacetylase
VALTGAGISVDSGIPDFRGGGGLWERYDPAEYATIDAFRRDPPKVWRFFMELAELKKARPNDGHLALARMAEMGFLKAIITQNIDGLHQAAGSGNVLEIHGTTGKLRCIDCYEEHVPAGPLGREEPPRCLVCGGLVKPAVVLFGEALPHEVLSRAFETAAAAKVLLAVGTSAIVSPANQIPRIAKQGGASIVEINLEETVLTGSLTDYFLKGSSSEVLNRLAKELKRSARPFGFGLPW